MTRRFIAAAAAGALASAALLIAGTLPLVPDDLEDAFTNLKEAVAKKDAALVKKLAADTCVLAAVDAEIESFLF